MKEKKNRQKFEHNPPRPKCRVLLSAVMINHPCLFLLVTVCLTVIVVMV